MASVGSIIPKSWRFHRVQFTEGAIQSWQVFDSGAFNRWHYLVLTILAVRTCFDSFVKNVKNRLENVKPGFKIHQINNDLKPGQLLHCYMPCN